MYSIHSIDTKFYPLALPKHTHFICCSESTFVDFEGKYKKQHKYCMCFSVETCRNRVLHEFPFQIFALWNRKNLY